jgi:hypothetical protein
MIPNLHNAELPAALSNENGRLYLVSKEEIPDEAIAASPMFASLQREHQNHTTELPFTRSAFETWLHGVGSQRPSRALSCDVPVNEIGGRWNDALTSLQVSSVRASAHIRFHPCAWIES